MRLTLSTLLLGAGCTLSPGGCDLPLPQPSNLPTWRVDCRNVDAGPSWGTLTGPAAFPVVAALEEFSIDDAGFGNLVIDLSDSPCPANSCWPGFFVLPDGGFATIDAGSRARTVQLYVATAGAPTQSKTPVIPGLGESATWANATLHEFFAGGGSSDSAADGGSVSLDAIAACSIDGALVASFPPDAGGAFSGTFHATYSRGLTWF